MISAARSWPCVGEAGVEAEAEQGGPEGRVDRPPGGGNPGDPRWLAGGGRRCRTSTSSARGASSGNGGDIPHDSRGICPGWLGRDHRRRDLRPPPRRVADGRLAAPPVGPASSPNVRDGCARMHGLRRPAGVDERDHEPACREADPRAPRAARRGGRAAPAIARPGGVLRREATHVSSRTEISTGGARCGGARGQRRASTTSCVGAGSGSWACAEREAAARPVWTSSAGYGCGTGSGAAVRTSLAGSRDNDSVTGRNPPEVA
jgi:hypothetical protein